MTYAAYAAPARAALPPRLAARPAAPRPAAGGAYGAAAGGHAATASRYREAELASATPGQLVVMLFDKCLLTVRRAEAAFAAGDVETRIEHVCKAADMVTELRASLDFEAGGAISTQLDALYAFTLGELFAANRHQDPARLAPVLRVLGDLREAFAGAQAQLAAQSAAPLAARGA
jgi:flagellar protein FliS